MPSFLQISDCIDVQPLKKALETHEHLFGAHKERAEAYGSPHTGMSDIWIRYNAYENFDKNNPAAFCAEHDSVWYPSYYAVKDQIKPILFGLMTLCEGERLGGVLITKVPPGGKVDAHIDYGWHAGYYEKIYVPVKNAPGAVFGFPDWDIHAKEGCAYWFRNDVMHWVNNDSDQDRIAMVVCIKTDKFKGMRG